MPSVTGPAPWFSAHRQRLRLWWRYRFRLWLPYRICCPWQPEVAEDGPYKAWRFRRREWFKRPWPEGRTREKYFEYRAQRDANAKEET